MRKKFILFAIFLCFAVMVKAQTGTGKQPLFVVDGKPMEWQQPNASPTINPNDIESLTVLNDASATAIYGSRGANGVVLVSTKAFAVKSAQSKLGNFSKQYKRYIANNADTKDITYAIDGRELTDTTMSVPRDVIKLSEKSIQKVEFSKPKRNQKGTVKITTASKP